MILNRNKIFLSKGVDIYFGSTGIIYVSGPLGTTANKLFFSFSFKNNHINRSPKNSTLKHLFALLRFNISSVILGYYIFIDLVGLGYKIKKITSSVYRFYLGQAHYIYVYVPTNVFFWAYQNKITLFSIYADKLYSLSTNIMLLRKLNAYKLRGLMRPGQIVILKEGKQR